MKYNPKYPRIPMDSDYRSAIKAMSVIRDFYGYNFVKNRVEKPNSYFGKKAALIQRAINLLPANLRHEFEEGRCK
jgi:hypothetical protein